MAERGRVSPRARIKLLLGAGDCLRYTGDLMRAADRYEEARQLAKQAGSPRMEGWSLYGLAVNAGYGMKFDEARRSGAQALQRFEVAGDQLGVGLVTFNLGAFEIGAAGDERHLLGSMRADDAQQLVNRLGPMLAVARAVGERNGLGHALEEVGTAAVMAQQFGEAAGLMADAIDAFDTLGNQGCLAHCLDRVAWLADETARPEDAVRLLAASQTLREHVGMVAPPCYAAVHNQVRNSRPVPGCPPGASRRPGRRAPSWTATLPWCSHSRRHGRWRTQRLDPRG